MTRQKQAGLELSAEETRLIEGLREHPEMRERVRTILELARNLEGPLRTADEVEELLVRELRLLGHTSMNRWAVAAEARVGAELQKGDASVKARKKKH